MTIDKAALYMELYKRKLFDSVSDLDKDIEAYDTAIDTMHKYQMFQVKYVERLKADMVAILTEIQLEIEEMQCLYIDFVHYVNEYDVSNLILLKGVNTWDITQVDQEVQR